MKIKSLIYKILVTAVIVIFGSLISLKNETIKANIYENNLNINWKDFLQSKI